MATTENQNEVAAGKPTREDSFDLEVRDDPDPSKDVDEQGREKIRVNVGGMRKTVQTQGMSDAQFEKFKKTTSVHHGDGDIDIGTLSMQITENLKKDEHIEEQKMIHAELTQTMAKMAGVMACQTIFIFALLVLTAWMFKDSYADDGYLVDSDGNTMKVGSANFNMENGSLKFGNDKDDDKKSIRTGSTNQDVAVETELDLCNPDHVMDIKAIRDNGQGRLRNLMEEKLRNRVLQEYAVGEGENVEYDIEMHGSSDYENGDDMMWRDVSKRVLQELQFPTRALMHGMEIPEAAIQKYRMARSEKVDTALRFTIKETSGGTGYGCALDAVAAVMDVTIPAAVKLEAITDYELRAANSDGNSQQVKCYDRGEPVDFHSCRYSGSGKQVCGTMDCELPNTGALMVAYVSGVSANLDTQCLPEYESGGATTVNMVAVLNKPGKFRIELRDEDVLAALEKSVACTARLRMRRMRRSLRRNRRRMLSAEVSNSNGRSLWWSQSVKTFTAAELESALEESTPKTRKLVASEHSRKLKHFDSTISCNFGSEAWLIPWCSCACGPCAERTAQQGADLLMGLLPNLATCEQVTDENGNPEGAAVFGPDGSVTYVPELNLATATWAAAWGDVGQLISYHVTKCHHSCANLWLTGHWGEAGIENVGMKKACCSICDSDLTSPQNFATGVYTGCEDTTRYATLNYISETYEDCTWGQNFLTPGSYGACDMCLPRLDGSYEIYHPVYGHVGTAEYKGADEVARLPRP